MSRQKKSFTLSDLSWWTGRDLNPRPFGHPRQNAYANRTFFGLMFSVYQAELPAPKTPIIHTYLKTLANLYPTQNPENVNTRPSPDPQNQRAGSSARLTETQQRTRAK